MAYSHATTFAPGQGSFAENLNNEFDHVAAYAVAKAGDTMAPASGAQALKVTPSGATPTSTSTGGAVLLDNSSATGAGMVLFSSRGSDQAGRLLALRTTNPAFAQQVMNIDAQSNGHVLVVNRSGGTPVSGNVIACTAQDLGNDTNPMDSTFGVSGYELAKGTAKISHNRPAAGTGPANNDVSASALSLRCNGTGTTAQLIFGDYEDGVGAAGAKMLNLRVSGTEKVVAKTDGSLALAGPLGVNGATPPAKPTVTGSRGGNAALASLLTALASIGLITDSTTA